MSAKYTHSKYVNLYYYYYYYYSFFRDKWVPVSTAWRVLRLRMEEQPPYMESSCEYIE
jgi:hypothetical protein